VNLNSLTGSGELHRGYALRIPIDGTRSEDEESAALDAGTSRILRRPPAFEGLVYGPCLILMNA